MNLPRKIWIVVSLFAVLWCVSIVAAPVLRTQGVSFSPALYSLFSEVCHQFPDRSFHIAGEPLGVCVRCSALYFGVLVSLLAATFFARLQFTKYPPAWILLATAAPMVLDAFLNLAGLHESTVWTRSLTGAAMGLVVPFFLMPPLIEAVHQLAGKFGGLTYAGKTK